MMISHNFSVADAPNTARRADDQRSPGMIVAKNSHVESLLLARPSALKGCMRDPLALGKSPSRVRFPEEARIISGAIESDLPADPGGRGIEESTKKQLWLSPSEMGAIRSRVREEALAFFHGDDTIEKRGLESKIDPERIKARKFSVAKTLEAYSAFRQRGLLKPSPDKNDSVHNSAEMFVSLRANKLNQPFQQIAHQTAEQDRLAADCEYGLVQSEPAESFSCHKFFLEPCLG